MSEDPGQITLFSKPLNNAYIWNTAILPGEYLGELLAALSASQFNNNCYRAHTVCQTSG